MQYVSSIDSGQVKIPHIHVGQPPVHPLIPLNQFKKAYIFIHNNTTVTQFAMSDAICI